MAMAAVLLVGLRRPLGLSGAVAAAAGASFSVLTLYYGRLALLEPTVALALSVAAISSVRADQEDDPAVGRRLRHRHVPGDLAKGRCRCRRPSGSSWRSRSSSVREIALRRFLAITIVMIGVVRIGWVVAVAIPQAGAVRDAISILPATAIPTRSTNGCDSSTRFIRSNDGVTWQALPLLLGALAGLVLAIDHQQFAHPGRNPISGPARVALVGVLSVGSRFLGVASLTISRTGTSSDPARLGVDQDQVRVSPWSSSERRRADRESRARSSPSSCRSCACPVSSPSSTGAPDRTRSDPGSDGRRAVSCRCGVTLAGGCAPLFAMRLPITTLILYPDTPLNSGTSTAGVFDGGRRGRSRTALGRRACRRVGDPDQHWCAPWGRDAVKVCLVELP